MRALAIREGLPSNIGKEEIVSKPAKVCELDLNTLDRDTGEGVLQDTKVVFEMIRAGPWDSVCAYDRVSSIQSRWALDASPAAKSMHWRQVI
jgi:hypothetical protein